MFRPWPSLKTRPPQSGRIVRHPLTPRSTTAALLRGGYGDRCGHLLDRVRVDEANRLRHDKKTRQVIKGARWLLLRNRENIHTDRGRVRLKELLQADKQLLTVYILKDDLKHLWDYKYPKAAKRFWEHWYRRAMESGIGPLVKFAQRLQPYLAGILAHSRWPLHTNLLEGINNKIKVIKRMAYGFRDDEYFFLKIRAAFPGNTG